MADVYVEDDVDDKYNKVQENLSHQKILARKFLRRPSVIKSIHRDIQEWNNKQTGGNKMSYLLNTSIVPSILVPEFYSMCVSVSSC